MVLRILYKRDSTPLSLAWLCLNILALAGLGTILFAVAGIFGSGYINKGVAYPNLVRDRSFLVFSADDWGRWTDSVPLFPNATWSKSHGDLMIEQNFWYRKATVETKDDLKLLLKFMKELNRNVTFEQRAVLTPHWVVGGPDFEAMKRLGCLVNDQGGEQPLSHGLRALCTYRERLLSDRGLTGLDQAPHHRGDLRAAYLELWKEGVWHPEYHGRSHFTVRKWLRRLQSDEKAQRCFQNGLVCASDTTELRSEFNGFSTKKELKTWLEGGINAFSSFWGYRPTVISSPHNTWNSWLVETVADLGFLGAELAEDQAYYVPLGKVELSLQDRYRFDVFFPGFQCDTAIKEITDALRTPKEMGFWDRWYAFLSMVDFFRVHYKPHHHSPGGDHERFISLMWHAQNAMQNLYAPEEYQSRMQCVRDAVMAIRRENPRTVFVTGSEMHQIRSRGWSREVWADAIVLRNYAVRPVTLRVPDLREVFWKADSWIGKNISIENLSGKNPVFVGRTQVGDEIHLNSDSVIRLTVGAGQGS